MRSKNWIRFLAEVDNLQMFSLCKDFDNLSLEDNTIASSSSSSSDVQPSSYGHRDMINRFFQSSTHSFWSKLIMERIRQPIIELPRNIMSSSFQSHDIRISIGFRFLPGQLTFLLNDLKLPESFERLSFLCDSIGLSYYSRNFLDQSLSGIRNLVTNANNLTQILVEVITYKNGMYGRFLVLVTLGFCSTVWYAFAPGSADAAPNSPLFGQFESYYAFFNMDYEVPGLSKLTFAEKNNVSETVVSALRNEPPFADITIPANGNVLKAVGLGVMVAIFLAVGLVPNVTCEINI